MQYHPLASLSKQLLLHPALRYSLILIAALGGYLWLAEYLGGYELLYTGQMWLEGLLALYLYGLGYALLRPSRWRPWLAGLPLLLLYLASDIFFLAFGKVFRLVNINELPELLQILPWSYSLGFGALIALPLLAWFSHIHWRPPRHTALALLPFLGAVLTLYIAPGSVASALEGLGIHPVKYSDAKSVEQNGRLAMLLYREDERQEALEGLAPWRDRTTYEQRIGERLQALAPHLEGRNVHLIALESFLDPRLFKRLGFSASPVHPAFETLFGERLGLSISPVFGGATAQAEFEILCGVPALERLSSVEFNLFTGAAAHCLPGELAALGYQSSATNTYKPNFFNAAAAYQGAGFTVSHFPREFTPASDSYLTVSGAGIEEYLFDAELFAQNLDYVRSQLEQHPDTPLFNYVLTIYGHTPHVLDPQQRPERITLISDYPDDHLSRATNQFYYRTEAIAAYVNELLRLDPDSLIVLVADHVPPLRNGPNTYDALDYLGGIDNAWRHNRIAIIDRGEVITPPLLHHYDLPSLILDRLSDGNYCQQVHCGFVEGATPEALEAAYLSLMAHASE